MTNRFKYHNDLELAAVNSLIALGIEPTVYHVRGIHGSQPASSASNPPQRQVKRRKNQS